MVYEWGEEVLFSFVSRNLYPNFRDSLWAYSQWKEEGICSMTDELYVCL